MGAGRPRTTSFVPEEMIKLGEEMIEWVRENDPLHLSQWYTIEKGFIYEEWKSFIKRPEFIPYYQRALKMVGVKYLDGGSKRIKDGISHRWQRVYFKDLKDQEDEDAKEEADRKKDIMEFEYKLKSQNGATSDELVSKHDSLMAQLLAFQMGRSERALSSLNEEDNTSTSESKS